MSDQNIPEDDDISADETYKEFGYFEGRLNPLWSDDGRTMTLLEPFAFVEDTGLRWNAPKDSAIDGASIPQAAWSLVGGPFSGKYRKASVVHDVACDVRDREWKIVHRMFHKGMRAGGVGRVKAKIMYWAVRRFGPRWDLAPDGTATNFRNHGDQMTAADIEQLEHSLVVASGFMIDGPPQVRELELDEIDAIEDQKDLAAGG